MNNCRILIVDDEEAICEIIQLNLQAEGYEVDVAYSAEEALDKPLNSYALIISDVMMGEISGFRFVQMLRNDPQTANIPIILCTAKEAKDDTIMGLNLGADDYIVKPFLARELVARVKSLLRRSESAAKSASVDNSNTLCYEGITIDTNRKVCLIDGQEVAMTKKELEILLFFLQNRGVIFSRAEILARVWSDEVVVIDRTIDVFITRLRKKIGRYGKNIVTKLGYGYGFEA